MTQDLLYRPPIESKLSDEPSNRLDTILADRNSDCCQPHDFALPWPMPLVGFRGALRVGDRRAARWRRLARRGAGRPLWLRYCNVTFSLGRISQWADRRAARLGPDSGRPARRRSTAFRDGWTASRRRASRNPAAPRNAVSPWEVGARRSAASRWEAAANPWLGAIAWCSRTGSSNPVPSSGESERTWRCRDCAR